MIYKFQVCPVCKLELPETSEFFFKNSIKKNGLDATCKKCRRIRSKAWDLAHKDLLNEHSRANYAKNKEAVTAKNRHKYNSNKNGAKDKRREYIEKHKEHLYEVHKIWCENNKTEQKDKRKDYRNEIVLAVFDIIGRTCSLCGESELEFLTTDHINTDGNHERKKFGNSIGFKRKILSGELPKENYRTLCHSCNLSIYHLNPVHHVKAKSITGKNKRCSTCRELKDTSEFHNNKNKYNGLCEDCRTCKSNKRILNKIKCFEFLGGVVCACCYKVTDPFKLCVDHVNNDGSTRRKENKERSGELLYKKILKGTVNKSDFQVLCFNCNYSKTNGGVCIHKRGAK